MSSKNRFFMKLMSLLLLGFSVTQPLHAANAQTNTMQVVVDFAVSTPKPSMSGFLHSLDTDVPESILSPLKPSWWRLSPSSTWAYKKAVTLGAKVQVVLSDSYGYPLNNWGGKGAPWENNWQNWDNHVRSMAKLYQGAPVYWDVWNEPDERDWNRKTFWNGTQAQFFEAYKRAYLILREELGSSVQIGGPSYANYEEADITAFLRYCNNNQLEVNFLSWHELGSADQNIPAVARHIAYMKSVSANYPALKLRTILINENAGPATHLYPGDIVGFLYYLEKGGAGGANKACWDASDGSNNCFNGSVDGVIVPGSYEPRAGWWTYKAYADGIGSRVVSYPYNENLVALSSRNPAQVMVGYFGNNGYSTATALVYLKNLPYANIKGNSVGVQLFKIPATGEQPLAKPVLIQDTRIIIMSGIASLTLKNLKLHEVFLIKLTP